MQNKIEVLLMNHDWEILWSENFEALLPYHSSKRYLSDEDMFAARKQIKQDEYVIDIGAYGLAKKKLRLVLIKNQNWEKSEITFEFSTFENLYVKINDILKSIHIRT